MKCLYLTAVLAIFLGLPLAAVGQPCPCDDSGCIGHSWNFPWQGQHTAMLLTMLSDPDECCRIEAAKKLGCCLNANAATCPQLAPALVSALQCDPSWKVRERAAWSIAYQNVANRCGWTSLFVASKLDPHWMVRDSAANALKVVQTQVSTDCIRQWTVEAKAIVKQFKGSYQPGKIDCAQVFAACCGAQQAEPTPAAELVAPMPKGN